LRGCKLNKKKDCEPASFLEYKQSDSKKLSADAKIIVALMKDQPLKRFALCKKACVSEATFSRNKRLLINNKVIKKTSKGYCLFNYVEKPNLWDIVQQKCLDAGAPLVDLPVKKLVLGEQDPITGWYKMLYHDDSIKGIFIHRGANELKSAASVSIPDDYVAFLLSKVTLREGDRLSWKQRLFEVKALEEVYDGNDFAYWLIKLVQRL